MGGWCYNVVRLWKNIKVAGPLFPKLLLEAGDGTRIWFWHHLRCGDSLLKDISWTLFLITGDRDAIVADYIIKKWLSSLEPLISHIIPPKVFATCKGKLIWSSLKSLSFQVKSYKALKWGVIVFFLGKAYGESKLH